MKPIGGDWKERFGMKSFGRPIVMKGWGGPRPWKPIIIKEYDI